jgi:hypothetical protein
MYKARRLTRELFDKDKNGWFYLENFDETVEGVIKEAYYGHDADKILFGLHMKISSMNEISTFYLGNFKDIFKIKSMKEVKRLYDLKGKKILLHKLDGILNSGIGLRNHSKQLELF